MGNSLITVGTRHVKVWRVEEQASTPRLSKVRQSDVSFLSSGTHRALPGRNCLLENLLEANFTSVVAVSSCKAIVSSDRGDVCLIDDADGTQRFSKVADAGFAVSSMAVDAKDRLHLAGSQGGLKTLKIKDAIETVTPPPSPARMDTPTITLTTESNQIAAIAALADYMVTVDSQHSIRLSHLCASDDESMVGDVVEMLPAHRDSVLGVGALQKPNIAEASFFTWSAGGSILFWGEGGSCKGSLQVVLEQMEGPDPDCNELKTVTVSADGGWLVTGDKYGVLR